MRKKHMKFQPMQRGEGFVDTLAVFTLADREHDSPAPAGGAFLHLP